jgi:ribose transport system ATP-binding protein
LIVDAAATGVAVLMCSSDAEELAHLCDRVIVLRAGRKVADLSGTFMTPERIVAETLGATSRRGAVRVRHRESFTLVRR